MFLMDLVLVLFVLVDGPRSIGRQVDVPTKTEQLFASLDLSSPRTRGLE